MKRPFFSFLELFEWRSRNSFLGMSAKAVRENVQNYLNENLVIASFLESCFGASVIWKQNLLSVLNDNFLVFCKLLSDQNETIFRKNEAKRSKNSLNQSLVIGSYLENRFKATLRSKTNVLSLWREHFPVFWKFYSDKDKTIFWES